MIIVWWTAVHTISQFVKRENKPVISQADTKWVAEAVICCSREESSLRWGLKPRRSVKKCKLQRAGDYKAYAQ
ncbi:MAG: hypothetical protein ACKERG_01270 [Candidatus Hodgkinia cicadicola]